MGDVERVVLRAEHPVSVAIPYTSTVIASMPVDVTGTQDRPRATPLRRLCPFTYPRGPRRMVRFSTNDLGPATISMNFRGETYTASVKVTGVS